MRKTLREAEAAKQIRETLEVIDQKFADGKIRVPAEGEKLHPLFVLSKNLGPGAGLDSDTRATLLVRWLGIQGVTLVFDDSEFRKHADQAVSRLETLMPPPG